MLRVDRIDTYYGAAHILQGLSLHIDQGESVALLGRNGAGKTTTMRSILGLTPARRGRIGFGDADITRSKPHRIARAGIAYVASGRRVFGGLTVKQNLELAARTLGGRRAAAAAPAGPAGDAGNVGDVGDAGAPVRWGIEDVLEVFPKLRELGDRRARFLSGGEQQMLKLGRALLGQPRLLLLDEPTEGLSPAVVADLGRRLDLLKQSGMTILLTEQNALFALEHADRGYVMLKGRITHAASAADLRESEEVRAALGVGRTSS